MGASLTRLEAHARLMGSMPGPWPGCKLARCLQPVAAKCLATGTNPPPNRRTRSPELTFEPSCNDLLHSPGAPAPSQCTAVFKPRECKTQIKFRSEEHTSELQSPCNLVCRL